MKFVWRVLGSFILGLLVVGCSSTDEPAKANPTELAQTHATQTAAIITLTPAETATPTPDPDITPTAASCVLNSEWQDTYIVQNDDTLGGIAIMAGVSVRALEEANCIEDRNLLRVGDILRVPNAIAIDIASSPQGIEGAVVFIRQNDDGSRDLWTVKSDGTALRQITQQGTIVGRPIRTWDAEFISYRVVSPFFLPNEDAPLSEALPTDIWIMKADGTLPTPLIDQGPADGLLRSAAVWSPDDERLAFTEQSNQRGALVVINADGSNRLVLVAGTFAPPENPHPIAPAWSPDGKQLAFMSWEDARPSLNLITLETLEIETLNSGFIYVNGPLWVPSDGEMGSPVIAFEVKEVGTNRWKIILPTTQEIIDRGGGLVMIAPNLAWRLHAILDGIQLRDVRGIPQQQALPPLFEDASWGAVENQFVMKNPDGAGLVLVDIANNLQRSITDGDDSVPVWTEPRWVALP